MFKKMVFTAFLITIISCFSYEWNQIGPMGENILNYKTTSIGDVFCTDHGFYTGWNQNWQFYSVGELPVVDVDEIHPEFLIVLCNGGSWSDGLYKFDTNSFEFELMDYVVKPNFIYRTNDGFYVGFEYGILFSSDCLSWTEIPFFNGMKIESMITNGSHFVATKTDMPTAIYISDDNGETWQESSHIVTNLGMIDLAYDYNDKLYGVFGGYSNSSGLWSSEDYGDHWQFEYYVDNLNAVYFMDGRIFIGWQESWDWEGVAQYDSETHQINMMNEGLGNLQINKFSTNDMIDCLNIVCCTMSGAYMCYDFEITNSEIETLNHIDIALDNYPNPFNPSTTISFSLTTENTELKIYNLKGQTIRKYSILNNQSSIVWDGRDDKGNIASSGIYLYKLKNSRFTISKKMILMK
ncbi:MAG: T9SS type A sorting domain-containing protein [Candidatus Cloacimonetes bacterium]|nr:T9SS type A sorting domain-containing protein [Candidatus Cloacimonadota bacterium]